MDYRSPAWLPGGQLQTIWPALYSRRHEAAPPSFTRERWTSPDDDFVDVDFAMHATPPDAPQLVLFHGLEGSSQSHYALAFADWARQQGMPYAVPHFRGCSGEINRAPRAYHSGDFQEIDWLLRRIKAREPERKLIAVGISLGGNALMRWAQEMGASASAIASAVASVCSPLDLAAAGHAIGKGFNRQIYTRMFLNTMKPKAMARLALHPKLFDAQALQASRDLYEFDNIFTAPLHGFRNTEDYWDRASAKPRMAEIQIPALALNARNDPFMPASSLPQIGKVGKHVTLWQPKHGGHVGFPGGKFPGHVHAMPRAVGQWLLHHG
ncbi:MAG: alpha/beta fold hydrolase [Burkholderiales bacterium]|nr:MAG: alpha/beta fold hydrolase [Burkholderiales bacterium]